MFWNSSSGPKQYSPSGQRVRELKVEGTYRVWKDYYSPLLPKKHILGSFNLNWHNHQKWGIILYSMVIRMRLNVEAKQSHSASLKQQSLT